MSEKSSESDIEPRRVKLAKVPKADIGRWGPKMGYDKAKYLLGDVKTVIACTILNSTQAPVQEPSIASIVESTDVTFQRSF